MALRTENIDPKILESEQIDGILNGFSIPSDAVGIAMPNVKFWDGSKYVSGFNPQTNGAIPEVITNDSIRQVSIDVDGKTRYFQQVDYLDGSSLTENPAHGSIDIGTKVTAWQEIDKAGNPIKINGKQEIRINFTGCLFDDDKGALVDVIDGELNPQALEAATFTNRVIKKIGKENISDIISGSHSIGAGNALAAHIVSDLEKVDTKTTLMIEPVGASLQLKLLKDAIQDEKSPFFAQLQSLGYSAEEIKKSGAKLDSDIENHVVSIRAIAKDEKGKMHGGAMGNVVPGFGIPEGMARESYRRASDRDDVPTGTNHENNKPLGKSYLQDITSPLAAPQAPINPIDNPHTLAMIVQGAGIKGVYYQVADADSTWKQAQTTPIKQMTTQIGAALPSSKGNSL